MANPDQGLSAVLSQAGTYQPQSLGNSVPRSAVPEPATQQAGPSTIDMNSLAAQNQRLDDELARLQGEFGSLVNRLGPILRPSGKSPPADAVSVGQDASGRSAAADQAAERADRLAVIREAVQSVARRLDLD